MNNLGGALDFFAESDTVKSFWRKVDEFKALYRRVINTEAVAVTNPELDAELTSLNNRAKVITTQIQKLTDTIDRVLGWVDSSFGDDGATALNGLGVLPLLPIAAIILAIGAMTKWSSDAYIYLRKVEDVERLKNQGMSPGQITDILGNNKKMFGFIPTPVVYIGGGLLGLFIARNLLRELNASN